MNYNLNWSLLGAPVDVGGAIQQGFQSGVRRNALGRLVQDPTNTGALSALSMVDPAAAMQMREHAETERFRQATRSAFDTSTGQFDAARMRAALAERGDPAAIQSFENSLASRATAQQELQEERAQTIARIAGVVRRQPYEQRRVYLQQLAPTLSQFGVTPEQLNSFDPTDEQLDAYIALGATGRGDQMTALQRDYEFMESLQPGLGRQMVEGRADPLVQMDIDGDGVPDIAPRSYVTGRVRGSAPAPVSAPSGTSAQQIHDQADAAIAAGADPEQVEARRAQLLRSLSQGGASPSNGSGNFQ